jgi:PKD repeat protein
MKKHLTFQKILMGFAVGSMVLSTSCKKDEEAKPTPDFTYEVNNLSVTFTNTSKAATTYSWDFGDSQTATEASPSHTFADYGTYTVTLEATGPGGVATVSYDVDVPVVEPIAIDSLFNDWASINPLCSFPDGEGRTLLEFKVMDSPNFLYIYVKGTSSIGEVLQVYIDADNDSTTGWGYWNWFKKPGLEYLMESVITGWSGTDPGSGIQAATGSNIDWPWESLISQNAINKSSGYVVSGANKVLEISLLKSMFSNPEFGNTIRILISNSDNTWANVGTLPPKETGLPPVTYVMKH